MAGPDEVGFMRARSHDIVTIDDCPLFAPEWRGAIAAARALAGEFRGLDEAARHRVDRDA